jgi:hypothetical protein
MQHFSTHACRAGWEDGVRKRRDSSIVVSWLRVPPKTVQHDFTHFATRRVKNCTEAMNSHAVAEAMVCSKSLARRRLRLSHALTLDNPAARQGFEALATSGRFDGLDGPLAKSPQAMAKRAASVAAVGEQVSQSGKR